MKIFPPHQIDFYKSGHMYQMPKDTELIFTNFTPRMSRIKGVDKVVFFGLQYFVKEYLMKQWQENFFDLPLREVINKYNHRMDHALGQGVVGVDHLIALHKLGYMPISIMAVPEGSLVDLRVPMFVIYNTNTDFYWLTNYLETVMSAVIWGGCTSATMAVQYRKILNTYADMTLDWSEGEKSLAVDYQAHDFSARGMFGVEAICLSGAAHLTVFDGTDSVFAIDFLQEYYNKNDALTPVGASIPATEHSVMCMGGDDDEIGTIRKLITETYPTGNLGIVVDTWDFWKVITEYVPQLKREIMARNGKVIFRPDSGNPVDIICGDNDANSLIGKNPAYRGAVECLWDIFGGTINKKGYKELDSHVGLIYGDSITLDRCQQICERLEAKKFASTNVVLGVGSYSYQYTTRDTYGFALKATYAEIAGKPKEIFKDPKTDDGTKKSLKGLVATYQRSDGSFYVKDQASWRDVRNCAFETVYTDGCMVREHTIREIRENIKRGM